MTGCVRPAAQCLQERSSMPMTNPKSILDKFCKVYGFTYCLDHFPYSNTSPFSVLMTTYITSCKPGGARLILEKDFVGRAGIVKTRHPTCTKRGYWREDFFGVQGPNEDIVFEKAVELLLDADEIWFYVGESTRRSMSLPFETLESLEIWLDIQLAEGSTASNE